MPSLKYPSGLKVKASLAWIGIFACGFIPIFYYYPTYIMKEHYYGVCYRNTVGESKNFHAWYQTGWKHSILYSELLNKHPQEEYSWLEKRRLGLDRVESLIK